MDGVDLILEAKAAGLSVALDGDRLVIRGPRSADAVARKLITNKPAVVVAMRWRDTVVTVTQPAQSLGKTGLCHRHRG